MIVTSERDGSRLIVAPAGRLTADTAPQLERELKASLEGVTELILDLAALEFLSSAGLRVILNAQKSMNKQGAMTVRNVSRDVMDIFEMTGIAQIITIEKSLREISVTGCPIIGKGCTGECYQLDAETIVKLYYDFIDNAVVEKEKRYAKTALVAGISTAISYDIVTCQGRRGVLYEMLNAAPFSQAIIDAPASVERYAQMFAEFCHTLHSTPVAADVYPNQKEQYSGYVRQMDFLSAAEQAAIIRKIEAVPDVSTVLHGDLHTSNVMLQDGELILIDMGDFAVGHPLFDAGQLYGIYYYDVPPNLCELVTGIPKALGMAFWEYFEQYYFDAHSEPQRMQVRHQLLFFKFLREIHLLTFLDRKQIRIDMIRHQLLPQLDSWSF